MIYVVKKGVKYDAHDTKNDKSVTYMAYKLAKIITQVFILSCYTSFGCLSIYPHTHTHTHIRTLAHSHTHTQEVKSHNLLNQFIFQACSLVILSSNLSYNYLS